MSLSNLLYLYVGKKEHHFNITNFAYIPVLRLFFSMVKTAIPAKGSFSATLFALSKKRIYFDLKHKLNELTLFLNPNHDNFGNLCFVFCATKSTIFSQFAYIHPMLYAEKKFKFLLLLFTAELQV